MPELKCCCRHRDASDCLAIRYGLDIDDLHSGDKCECACHHNDEDGNNEWDRLRNGYFDELDEPDPSELRGTP